MIILIQYCTLRYVKIKGDSSYIKDTSMIYEPQINAWQNKAYDHVKIIIITIDNHPFVT